MRLILSVLLFVVCFVGFGQVGIGINNLIGGSGYDTPRSIQPTNDGGYLVAGGSTSSATGDVTGTNHGIPMSYDWWIVKIGASGNIAWNKLLGGSGDEVAVSIQQTSDSGYIVAGSSGSSANGDVTEISHGGGEYWIVKLNGSGNIVWNKLLGGNSSDIPQSIQQTNDGGYIVGGYSRSSANGDVTGTNHGLEDYWIVKLDSAGNILWNKLLGGNGQDIATSIQQTNDGGYIVGGYSRSSANGDVTGTTHGIEDYWIVKLDAAGNIVWNKLIGGNSLEWAQSIQQTSDGGYIVAGYSYSSAAGDVSGYTHGYSDYWVVKLDATGNIMWDKLLGGNNYEWANSIQQTADGGYIVAGYTGSSESGDVTDPNHGAINSFDYWVVKLDGSGNITWNKLLGGTFDEQAFSIKQTSDGGYVVAGHSGSNDDDITGLYHGEVDYWIVKLDPNGNIALLWTGSHGTAWEDPANWSSGNVPDANSNVIINSSSTIIINSHVTIRTLTLSPGANLTVQPGYTLTILQ